MAKQYKNTNQKTAAAVKPAITAKAASAPQIFTVKYPMLLLTAAVVIVYIWCKNLGYTELDDTIFIKDFRSFNEDFPRNLLASFHRGVFSAMKDTYYRPLFLDSMILNYKFSGDDPMGYHLVNIALHLLSVLLLFNLFKKLGVKELHAFILTLLFAVHPVLTQAVAWIPGRNDTLLAVFTLSFFICSINYSNNGKLKWLLLSILTLLCAFFTKETAVFDAPVAFILIVYLLKKNWLDKKNIIQYAVWTAAFVLWYSVRATATLQTSYVAPVQIMHDFFGRLPVIIQYTGKIFLPFNLNVFPILEDTVNYYGIAAIIFLALIIYFAKGKDKRAVITGIAIFLLFLLPVLLVPKSLNEQLFEHRLYLPIIGILFILPQTILFKNKLNEKQLFWGWVLVASVLAVANIYRQSDFNDPLSFWTSAEASSPNSAYAVMMYGARVGETDKEKGYALMRRAYTLNPNEKYLNYYYGVMLQNEDSIQASEKYFLKEKKISDYYQCDFYLARVALSKNPPDTKAAAAYLESYLIRDPANPQANNNLLVLYLQTNQKAKALAQIKHMQSISMPVPADVQQKVNGMK